MANTGRAVAVGWGAWEKASAGASMRKLMRMLVRVQAGVARIIFRPF
jgi:hypothetical protein